MMKAEGRKRQVGFYKRALIGIVGVIFIIAIFPHALAADDVPSAPKFGVMPIVKRIHVTNLSPQINALIAAANSTLFFFRDYRSSAMGMNASGIDDKARPIDLYGRLLEFVLSDVQMVEHPHPRPTANVVSGSRSTIADFKIEAKPLLYFTWTPIGVHPNIGAQLPLGRVFGVPNQFRSGPPQEGGKYRERSSMIASATVETAMRCSSIACSSLLSDLPVAFS